MVSELIASRPGAFEIAPASSETAIEVADGLWMSEGLSNTYCLATARGRMIVNCGMGFEAAHHRRLFDAVAPGPTRWIVVTQAHVDHVGGVDHFRDEGTELIAHSANADCQADDARIHRFRVRRSMPFWADAISAADSFIKNQPADAEIPAQSTPTPDVVVEDRLTIDAGDRRIDLLATPGGETLDSLVVWLPDERIAVVGNIFGALFGHIPNLVTLRGDRPRDPLRLLQSFELVRSLGAETLCVGHFQPVRGAEVIDAELARLDAALRHVHDATVAAMNDGRSVHEAMAEVSVPPDISVGEGYGLVAWAVRAIWEGYAGWFQHRSTTELYAIDPAACSDDLVLLAGGADNVADLARRRLADGRPLAAVQLCDVALAADPTNCAALEVSIEAHTDLAAREDRSNFWRAGWLEHQRRTLSERLEAERTPR